MACNGIPASDRLMSGQSDSQGSRSGNRHDTILVPSSPDLPPMPALSSMPATATPHSKFSMHAFSMSSSPSLPSRTIKIPLPEKIPIPKLKGAVPHQDYVTLDSTPDSAARIAPATQTIPPSGATRSAYFAGGEMNSSQNESIRQVTAALNATSAEKERELAAAPRPERYDTGDLVQAVSRRRDWTPPPIDTATLLGEGSSPSVEKWSSPRGSAEPTGNDTQSSRAVRGDVFKTLHDNYRCSEAPVAAPVATPAPLDSFFTNRKTIEAVSLGVGGQANGAKNKSPTKAAPKKKPRTLTELAMAAYADPPADEDGTVEAIDPNPPPKKRGRPKRQLEVIGENGGEILPTQPSVVRPGFPTTKLRKLQSAAAAAATTTADGKKVKKPRKKPAPRTKKQVVLSPESARAESMRQDFLFGTSSQLAADESPTFLRQLHAAMQESNGHRSGNGESEQENSLLDLFEDASEIDLTSGANAKTKTKLWGAAWRGEDGQVTLEHVVDLEGDEAASFPEDPHQVLAMAQRAAAEQAREGPAYDVGIEKADEVDLIVASKNPKTAKASQAAKAAKEATLVKAKATAKVSQTQPAVSAEPAEPASSLPLKPVAGARNKILPATPTKTQTKTQSQAQALIPSPTQSELIALMSPSRPKTAVSAIPAPPATTTTTTRPNFEVLSTAQLSSKVSSYGYKPMKVRSAMVALLNQCWNAKNAAQASAAQVVSISTTSAPASPAKAKGGKAPTKAAKAAKTASPTRVTKAKKATVKKTTSKNSKSLKNSEIEILDSDVSDGDRLSSPEVPCSVASDASLAYDSDIGDIIVDETEAVGEVNSSEIDMDDEALAGEPTCEETRLFTLITEAVTSAPSTTNPVQPSWHEKMLMYDTIILEEFTEWVNSVLGEANEVTELQAKKWCESKSVCCTWRKNTRGKERKL